MGEKCTFILNLFTKIIPIGYLILMPSTMRINLLHLAILPIVDSKGLVWRPALDHHIAPGISQFSDLFTFEVTHGSADSPTTTPFLGTHVLGVFKVSDTLQINICNFVFFFLKKNNFTSYSYFIALMEASRATIICKCTGHSCLPPVFSSMTLIYCH